MLGTVHEYSLAETSSAMNESYLRMTNKKAFELRIHTKITCLSFFAVARVGTGDLTYDHKL